MFHKLLKSIANDINLLDSLHPDDIGLVEYENYLDSINFKIRSIKNYDRDFWLSLNLDCHSFCDVKKAINAYLKRNK